MATETQQAITPDQFMRLFLRHEREILRYVSVLVPNLDDAQEIVQETAAALWRKIDQYDPQQPFGPWACRFALLEVRQFVRRSQRWPAVLDDQTVERLLARRQHLAPQLDRRREHLAACVGKLVGDQRTIIERYYYDQSGVEAIARQLDRTKEAIYKSLQRIRRALSDCVERRMRREEAQL